MRLSKPASSKQRGQSTLLALGILSILVAILVLSGMIFGVLGLSLVTIFAYVGTPVIFALIFLKAYRTVKGGDPEKIDSLKVFTLVAAPFVVLGGALVSLIGFGGVSPDRIPLAGQAVVEFDAFLSVGWSIGFSILDSWAKEVRRTRKYLKIFASKGITEASEALDSAGKQPPKAIGALLNSIGLFVISATLSVLAMLSENSILLGVSIGTLLVAVGTMLLTWYDLYRKAESLRNTGEIISEELLKYFDDTDP